MALTLKTVLDELLPPPQLDKLVNDKSKSEYVKKLLGLDIDYVSVKGKKR